MFKPEMPEIDPSNIHFNQPKVMPKETNNFSLNADKRGFLVYH